MKQLLPLFLFLLPCLALAQYPTNGNQKITLGEQTSADGLVYRGVLADTGIITPSSDTSAYIILDTVNNRFYNYNRTTNVWSASGGGISVSGTSGQVAYFNGNTSVTGDAGLIYSAANKTLAINSPTTSGALLILKNSQEPTRNTSWLTNQTFGADTTNWTKGTGWTFNGTLAVATAATGALTYTTLPDTIISGRAYEITYTQSGYTSGTATIALGNVTLAVPQFNVTANKILLLPTSATGGFRITTSTYTGNFDNIAIVEINNPTSILQGTQLSTTATINNEIRATSLSYYIGGGGRWNTGNNNISHGVNSALLNTTGNNWIAQGLSAGQNNVSGSDWVAQGSGAGFNNTIGSNWVAQGTSAGENNRTGSFWVAQGSGAGLNNISGSSWVAQGRNAANANTTGSNWVAQGFQSAIRNTTGSNWVAVGFDAARRYSNAADNATFTNSVYFGADTRVGGTSGERTNENVFGYAAIGQGDNTIMLGNSSIDATNGLYCYDTGIASPSDARDKTNIENLNTGLDLILALRPVKFTWNMRDYGNVGNKDIGFIAQEVDSVQNITGEADNIKLVNTNNDEQYWMQRDNLIPILVKAIQQQQSQIELLKQRILNLENK
jgi:hypothetical protein